MIGYSIAFFPRSWAFGVWRKMHKTLWALGPLRFVRHNVHGGWKQQPDPPVRQVPWSDDPSPSEFLADGTPAGGALEPVNGELRTQGKYDSMRTRAAVDLATEIDAEWAAEQKTRARA